MTIGCNGWWKCRVGDSRIGRVFKTKFPLIENRKYGHHLLGFNYHHFVTNNASKSHAQEALSDILMMAEFRRRFVGGLWRPLVLFVSQEVSLVYFQERKSFSTLNLFFFLICCCRLPFFLLFLVISLSLLPSVHLRKLFSTISFLTFYPTRKQIISMSRHAVCADYE